MKKALLLHGWEGDSSSNWFPWLKSELKKKGYMVYIPDLPNTNYPVLKQQLEVIKKYAVDFLEGDIIIGHSLGCTLTTQFLEENTLRGINVILVAPTYPHLSDEIIEKLGEYYETLTSYYSKANTFEKLDNNYTIFLSDNDPYITVDSAKKYYSQFENAEFRECNGYGHFMDRDGFLQLPEILDYIK